MAITELTDLIPPPPDPVEAGSEELWDEIQQDLGLPLPDDLRDFGFAYGTGKFVEQGILVFNPFAAVYRNWLNESVSAWQSLRDGEGDAEVPFDLFPSTPGLLPWGSDEGGAGLFWLTEGTPDNWPILVRGHEKAAFHRYEMELTTFISKVMKREILLKDLWLEEIFEDASRLVFQPSVLAVEAEPRKTVYQLYAMNDNRVGFWIQHENWEGSGTEAFVKSIDGKTQGPLIGDGKVLADIYENGVLYEEDFELHIAGDAGFLLRKPPTGGADN